MLRNLKNMAAGFLISFMGTIPMGYLVLIGTALYTQYGVQPTMQFILGVVVIEGVVIYATLQLADTLLTKVRLAKTFSVISIVFLLILALVFYQSSDLLLESPNFGTITGQSNFVLGVLLSSMNMMQILFWSGWNVYLLNHKYITMQNGGRYVYVLGAACGSFTGMYLMIVVVGSIVRQLQFSATTFSEII
ncbi:MAG: hypothetical protein ITG00_11015, partial [Flavobacterium sp.]|nr:hypothetical protein [Flavobacterium sp.]